jgi:biopolymer transport protein ExbB
MRPAALSRNWLWIGLWLAAIVLSGEAFVRFVPSAAPSVQAQDDAATEEGGGDAAEQKKPTESLLVFLFRSLGIRYVIAFLFLSFTLVAYMVMCMLGARRDTVCPPHLVASFDANLNEKKYQEAYELAKNDDSMLGQILAAGMSKLSVGYDSAKEAMEQVNEDENMKIDRRLGYIGLIGTIAPMVGLLGTVDGMVASFQVIANSTQQPKPNELAEGISMALVTTLVGLWLAIPAIVSFTLLKMRMAKLTFDVAVNTEVLMSRFQTMNKK